MNNEIRKGKKCGYNLHVHLVFVTKYRRGVFTKEVLEFMAPIFEAVCLDF
jgi:putative transposase